MDTSRNSKKILMNLHDEVKPVVVPKEKLAKFKTGCVSDDTFEIKDSTLVSKHEKGFFYAVDGDRKVRLTDEQMKKFGADLSVASDDFELEENEEVLELADSSKYVVRDGEKIKLTAQQIANKKKPRGGLSAEEYKARKESLKQARKKSHTAGAMKKRAFSMKRRQRVVDAVDLNTLRVKLSDCVLDILAKELSLTNSDKEAAKTSIDSQVLVMYDEETSSLIISTPRFVCDDTDVLDTDESIPLIDYVVITEEDDFAMISDAVVSQFVELDDLLYDEATYVLPAQLNDAELNDADKLYSQDFLIDNPPSYVKKENEEDYKRWRAAVHKATGDGKKEVKFVVPAALYKNMKLKESK